jgi:thiamine biosynthesis lipoprotein
VVSISLYDKQEEALIDGSFDLIEKYEAIYSRTLETSELYKLNHGTAPKVSGKTLTYSLSEELYDIISNALDYSRLTGGAFDLTIAPITSIWDFKSQEPTIPEDTKLKQALSLVDYKNIQLSGNEIVFAKEGIEIDLGAIAKGFIADKVKEYLTNNGVKSAIINLGGNLLCIGEKPDHTPFHIGIQKPYADRNETIATMEISDRSVVSSGVYERFFEIGGKFYHHILNPRTGYPYDNGLISVTIISPKSVDGDGLSTSCFALGLEKGLQLIESLPDTYAVFITEDYELHYSSGFEAAIRIK